MGDRGRKEKKNKKVEENVEEYDYDYGQGGDAIYNDYGYISFNPAYNGINSFNSRESEGFSCWSCSRNYWDSDSTGDLYEDCRNNGKLEICDNHVEDSGSSHYSAPVSCQITERRFFGIVTELH